MDDETTPRLVSGLKARAHDGRSELYRYLRREHRVLSRTIARHNPSWASIAAEVTASSIMGANGKPASPTALRQMWKRVCRDVDAEKADRRKAKTDRGPMPSRLPASWKPMPADLPQATPAPRYAPSNTAPARTAPIELSEEARATLAALDRQLDHRDRFVSPPKRKD